MQALQGKADSLRALAASFAPQAAAADAETLEKVQHAVKRLKAFVSIGHSLSEGYVRKLGRSINDPQALRALASHIVRIDVLASSVTAMKRSFECGGIDMGDQLSSLLASVRELRATATQAEQEAQYLQDNPEAAAKALQEDAANDAAEAAAEAAAGDTNGSSSAINGTNGTSDEAATPSEASHEDEQDSLSEASEGTVQNDVMSEADEQIDDSDSSVGVYEETTDTEDEDLESVEGLHNSIQRQRSRLQTLMTRVESLQHLAANLEAQEEGKGEQNVEALRNAVVELAKLRQMVESDDAALQSHDAALGAASERASSTRMPDPAPVAAAPPEPVSDGVTVRKMPGVEAAGTTTPHLRRRRPTVDMYTSRHERAQEENERPRHREEISKISERILRESESLRQELREREARMDGLPPPEPRTREQVWASARRRRPTGDYGSRRTSEGSARENASAIRRRSSASRLRPPPQSDPRPVGSDWSSREQSPHSQGTLSKQESREGGPDRAWEMFASGDSGRDGRSQDRSGKPFVRMNRRSSYESRRSSKAGDEENQRRRRGSVDFSVRGNKAAATDWTSTDWNDTSTSGRSAAQNDTSTGSKSDEQGGFWGAAKRLFTGAGTGDSGSGNKPFVRPKKNRPQRSSPRIDASHEDNVQRRVIPELDRSSAGNGDFWGNSLSHPVQDQGRTDDAYTRTGSSATPYVHKRKSVDYTSRYSSADDTADDVPSPVSTTPSADTGAGGFWGSEPSAIADAERDTQQGYDYTASQRYDDHRQGAYAGSNSSSGSGFWGSDAAAAPEAESRQVQGGYDYDRDAEQERASPGRTEPQISPRSSGFWASNPTVAEAAVEAGAVLRDTGYSPPASKPFVHRRRVTKQSYAARRSTSSGGDTERRRSISDKSRRASKTAYSAFSEASDYLAHSSVNEEQRKVPLVRKKVPDYSARRGGATRENFAAPTRRGRSTQPQSQPDVPSDSFDTHGRQNEVADVVDTSSVDLEAQSSAFSESVSSLRDAIARRSRSDSRRRAPSRSKSRDSSSPSRGSYRGREEESTQSPVHDTSRASDSAAGGGTDWSSDSWSTQNPSTSPDHRDDSVVGNETRRASVAVRRRKVVDYAARRSGVEARGSRAERVSARRPPQSHRVDVPAYESEPENSGTYGGAGGNGTQQEGGEAQRGAARYTFGDTASSGSYDTRRRSSSNYNGSSHNGASGGPRGAARYSVDNYSDSRPQNPPTTDNREFASSSSDRWSQTGAQGSTDWNDSSNASSNGAGGGKPFVKAKRYSYSSRRGAGDDEENARRGRRRSLDARRR